MLKDVYPFYVANRAEQPNSDLEVQDKYTGEVVTRVAMAGESDIERAIEGTLGAIEPLARMSAYERQAVLYHCVRRFEERAEELAMTLCIEAGKPINDSRGEVMRLIDTFRIAAEESVRIHGEVLELEISPRARGYSGYTRRFPIGPCSFISPFNFPLNLVAHKVAPALAVGCPFILKPASLTPIGALIIGETLLECDLPEGSFSILPCRRDGARLFTEDERLKLLSFTGSPDVGWALKAKAGKKPVILELGGNAAVLVDEDADIEDAVARILIGAFYQSGQSCIGVQRILIHESIYAETKARLVEGASQLIAGDPKDPATFIGPMISDNEASRLQGWIQEAIDGGATLLCGGGREGNILDATLLEDVDPDLDLVSKEAFGPVAVLSSVSDFDEGLRRINDSVFGLQAGVFTKDLYKAKRAWEQLDVGGVIIGDAPSWRVDHMPYGGVKDSGLGREGIRYAIEDMTEQRIMVVREKQTD